MSPRPWLPVLDARWWRWPRAGAVTSYGFRRYQRPDGTWHYHQGVDFAAPVGTVVRAPADGVVVVSHGGSGPARGFGGYGRVVVVRHELHWTLYAHLDSVHLPAGSGVSAGQQLGTVGRTCFTREDPTRLCRGAHLHFEVASTPYPKRRDVRPGDVGRVDPRTLY